MSDHRTEAFLFALGVLDNVDKLLAEGGYQPDSSARHQLSIARGSVSDLMNLSASPSSSDDKLEEGIRRLQDLARREFQHQQHTSTSRAMDECVRVLQGLR